MATLICVCCGKPFDFADEVEPHKGGECCDECFFAAIDEQFTGLPTLD